MGGLALPPPLRGPSTGSGGGVGGRSARSGDNSKLSARCVDGPRIKSGVAPRILNQHIATPAPEPGSIEATDTHR